MPLRAFIDSDGMFEKNGTDFTGAVLMPLRAFIDSDGVAKFVLFAANSFVLMPLRAFIDSDLCRIGGSTSNFMS